MAYCRRCGEQIDDLAVVCPKCGVPQKDISQLNDSGNAGWAILGFFFPLIGLILYLVWNDSKPKSAKMAGKGALISVCVGIGICILMFIIMISSLLIMAATF